MALTLGQRKLLAVLPRFTAFLSILGSSWISIEIFSQPKKLQKVYHRLVLAMSLYDIIQSIWYFASTWPVPSDAPNVWGAAGNRASCTAQGFFMQMGLAVPIYNTSLAVFYLLVIRQKLSEERIRTRYEPIFHGIGLALPLGTSSASAALGLFNNANLWCWIAPYPLDCQDSRRYGETTCLRGDNAWIYRWAFFYAPLWFCIVLVMIIMSVIFHSVNRIEAASSKYAHSSSVNLPSGGRNGRRRSSSMSSAAAATTATDAAPGSSPSRRRSSLLQLNIEGRRSREVANQAFWYVGAFYITFLFPTINRVLQQTGTTKFGMLVMHAASLPSQGIFNFIVYRRPRIIRLCRDYPHLNILQILLKTMRFSFMSSDRNTTRNSSNSDDTGGGATRRSSLASRRSSFGPLLKGEATAAAAAVSASLRASSSYPNNYEYDIEATALPSSNERPLSSTNLAQHDNKKDDDDDNYIAENKTNRRRVSYLSQPEIITPTTVLPNEVPSSSQSSDSAGMVGTTSSSAAVAMMADYAMTGSSSRKTTTTRKFDSFMDDDFIDDDDAALRSIHATLRGRQPPPRSPKFVGQVGPK